MSLGSRSRAVINSECAIYLVVLLLLCPLLSNVEGRNAPKSTGICAMQGCNCTVKAIHWIFVKCVFSDYQHVELTEGTIPEDTMEIDVSHCRELRIQSGAFSGGNQLKRVHVSGIYTVVANKQAFQNMSAPNPLLEVSDCGELMIDSNAFKNSKGPLSVSITRCKQVRIKPNAFSWLLQINIKDVTQLELSSNAFKFEPPPHGRHGPATKITFQKLQIPNLPTAVFPSSAAEIRMDDIQIDRIKKDAFCAMDILRVIISNATISEIETDAFSDRTLISNLEFIDVQFGTIRTGAFRAGANNLTVQYSRIDELEAGAISITVATVSFNNNEFQTVRSKAVTFDKLNNIVIDFNSFQRLESDALSVNFSANPAPSHEFSFSNNHLHDVFDNSLNFVASVPQKVKTVHVNKNFFQKKCNCNLDAWMMKVIGNKEAMTWMLGSSYCIVDNLLQGCFSLPEGHLSIENYTKSVCSKNLHINCSKIKPYQQQPSSSPPSIGPHIYPRHKGYFDVEMSDPDELEQEKRIIIIACVGAVFIIVIVILTSGILYVRRRGVCTKISSGGNNSWFSPTSGMTAATSARSISRLSVHEYTGFQPDPRNIDMQNQPETTNLEQVESEIAENMYAYTENKATQTLPEQLTEEYLKELQVKLNNPDHFSEARNIIEHLYDLINVEESCNNNNEQRHSFSQYEEDNAYDVIRPRVKRNKTSAVSSVTIGTKIPSLDKLVPQTMKNRPQIVEYAEPRDRKYNDQNHLYTELPADDTMPSTSKLAKQSPSLSDSTSHYAESDIVGRLAENKNGYFAVQKTENNDSLAKGQTKSLNFLKSFSGNILGGSKTNNMISKRSNSLMFEYADTDDATHLYSELTEPQSSTSSNMANRPLPTKPDQDAECTEPLAGL